MPRTVFFSKTRPRKDTRQQKLRQLARCLHGRRARDIVLHHSRERPVLTVAHRPARTANLPNAHAPGPPLDPPIDALRFKNVDKMGSRMTKKKRGRVLDVRGCAGRRSTPCAGAACSSAASFWTITRTRLRRKESPLRSRKWSITSDQTPSLCDDNTPLHASGAELDLAAERASTLDHLGAIFGEANAD
jgi:hypothetical protein